VGVLLNITDDHLDRYPSFAAYAAAKGRLFMGQRAEDFAVVPAGDELCLSMARAAASALATFGGPGAEVRREQGCIIDSVSGLRIAQDRLGIQGEHNVDNACAAALAARLIGIAPDQIEQVLTSFKGLPHRMQWVDTVGGVRFFDDSKATNVGAAVAAVEGLAGQSHGIVLIAGGKDKGGSYAPLREALTGAGRGLVLIGEAAAQIEQAFAGSGLPVVHAASMFTAVEAAWKMAAPNAAVLLAPACASFDMFRSYAHRGEAFCQAVQVLGKELGS
jgi:UDP-N-acetylmuramoylalanine--D-glutamate ligase